MTPARLALEDGTVFSGVSVGAPGRAVGEVVFNTAMTGYQEILTDPSYAGQLVTLTTAHVGNTGVNAEDLESGRIHAAGLIVRNVPRRHSSWRARGDLPAYLAEAGVPGIAELDTRQLTRHIRECGAMGGAVVSVDAYASVEAAEAAALEAARAFGSLSGRNLADEAGTRQAHPWTGGTWDRVQGHREADATADAGPRIVVVDFGVKHQILRQLVGRGCRVTVLPPSTDPEAVVADRPDGVLLSNGPGDPEPVANGIAIARRVIEAGIPTLGICLGHQILGLAAGGRTVKMPHGHHGANHPVREHATGKVLISSQNHGFAVDADSLPEGVEVTHTSLFDGTLQGIAFRDRPVLGFQGHPEASPGPHDVTGVFDRFVALVEAGRQSGER